MTEHFSRIIGNSRTARTFAQIGRTMDVAAANLPRPEPLKPVPMRDCGPLDIMRLMDRLNEANGSTYRNLPIEEAAQ
jgi:hypothetical protein